MRPAAPPRSRGLVAAQVGQPCAELPAPGYRAAIVADVAGVQRRHASPGAVRAPSPLLPPKPLQASSSARRPDAPTAPSGRR